MEPKLPTLYRKRDRNFYFTFRGRQYYAGTTPEKADRKLLEIVGTANSDGPHSIKDAVKEYLDSIEGVQSPDSVISKRRTYKRVFALLLQVKSIYDITPEVLETYRSKMLKTLEKTSVNSVFLHLSAFLQHFVVKGVLLQNSARKLPKLKLFADPSPDFLDEDERAKLLGFCDECRDREAFGRRCVGSGTLRPPGGWMSFQVDGGLQHSGLLVRVLITDSRGPTAP